jgi:flagellar assembly protein FliH
MSAPRRLTPPSAQAAPRPRTPMSTLPWNLAEFSGPVSGASVGATSARNIGCTPAELTTLREQMQEQHVRAVADARKAAFEEGRSAGRAEAHAAADRRVADAVNALVQATATIRHHEELYAGALEENLVALATAIARHVIQREVQVDPSRIRALVQTAVAEFPHETALKVRLHPQDHALLNDDASYRDVTWVADARIVRGGCVVEGRERIIDGRVDLALEQVFRQLTATDA